MDVNMLCFHNKMSLPLQQGWLLCCHLGCCRHSYWGLERHQHVLRWMSTCCVFITRCPSLQQGWLLCCHLGCCQHSYWGLERHQHVLWWMSTCCVFITRCPGYHPPPPPDLLKPWVSWWVREHLWKARVNIVSKNTILHAKLNEQIN